MTLFATRRAALAALIGLSLVASLPALAQDKPTILFADVTQAEAPRSKAV